MKMKGLFLAAAATAFLALAIGGCGTATYRSEKMAFIPSSETGSSQLATQEQDKGSVVRTEGDNSRAHVAISQAYTDSDRDQYRRYSVSRQYFFHIEQIFLQTALETFANGDFDGTRLLLEMYSSLSSNTEMVSYLIVLLAKTTKKNKDVFLETLTVAPHRLFHKGKKGREWKPGTMALKLHILSYMRGITEGKDRRKDRFIPILGFLYGRIFSFPFPDEKENSLPYDEITILGGILDTNDSEWGAEVGLRIATLTQIAKEDRHQTPLDWSSDHVEDDGEDESSPTPSLDLLLEGQEEGENSTNDLPDSDGGAEQDADLDSEGTDETDETGDQNHPH